MTYPPTNPDPYGQQPDPYAQSPYGYGSPVAPGSPVASGSPIMPASGQPQYGQPYAAPAGYGQPNPYPYQPVPQQNSMALVSMILSIVGIGTGITALIGAILGHVALKQIRQTGETGETFAKVGIIVGWVITSIWALGCIGYIAFFVILIGATANGA